MFCGKSENKSINKIHKRTLQLIHDTEDTTVEDLLERDNSRSIHEDNMHTLLVGIYKSIYYINPLIMWNSLDLEK